MIGVLLRRGRCLQRPEAFVNISVKSGANEAYIVGDDACDIPKRPSRCHLIAEHIKRSTVGRHKCRPLQILSNVTCRGGACCSAADGTPLPFGHLPNGETPPETLPINTIKGGANEAYIVGDDACDIPKRPSRCHLIAEHIKRSTVGRHKCRPLQILSNVTCRGRCLQRPEPFRNISAKRGANEAYNVGDDACDIPKPFRSILPKYCNRKHPQNDL